MDLTVKFSIGKEHTFLLIFRPIQGILQDCLCKLHAWSTHNLEEGLEYAEMSTNGRALFP